MSLKSNVIANYIGQGWNALMSLAFVPVYIKYLGVEAYGLIGLFALIQAWLVLLDAGMAPTLSREMARFVGGQHSVLSIRILLRSIETIVFSLAVIISLSLWSSSNWLASHWLQSENISPLDVAHALSIMGMIMAVRFIENIYRSSLIGLQRQVTLNIITSIMATLKGAGAVGILIWVSPSLEAFFIWQGVLAIITVFLLAYMVYHKLPKAQGNVCFSVESLQEIKQFAGGMLGITFLALLLTQVDKILLSKLLTLEEFGYYSLASLVAGSLFMLVNPITQAYYPRLNEFIAKKDKVELIKAYHQGAQLVTVVVGSAGITLIFFAKPILLLWTQDENLVQQIVSFVILIALGNILNSLMWIPYQTQLAHGWTSLAIKINLVSVALLIPAIVWIVPIYGAIGAAWIWVLLNMGYLLIGVHFMYRRILSGEKWKWYFYDVITPLSLSTIMGLFLLWLMPSTMIVWYKIAWLFFSYLMILIVSISSSSFLRIKLKNIIRVI